MSKKGAKGLQADVTDLVLRSGKQLTIEVGGVEVPMPNLVRDMEASSELTVPIFDPTLEVLEKTLLSEKFDAYVDDLRFRYVGASKSGPSVTLNFEDQTIARLRELKGPKRAFRAKQTRANFICGLVEELKPEVPIFCPQRHEKQPIEKEEPSKSERQSKKKEKEAEETPGGKGLGDTKGLNIEGVPLSPSQKELANTALTIANQVGAKFQVQVALVAALIDESTLGAATPQNVLAAEQEVNGEGAPVGTAEEEISGFLTGKPKWTGPGAIAYYNANPGATFYEIAQETQASGAGKSTKGAANYGKYADEARQIVEAFGGATGSTIDSSEEVTEPYTFKVGKKETYWGAIQRLAKEVEWRAFVVEGRFFFISEPELSRGQVQLAIEREPGKRHPKTRGIIEVDFEYDVNLPTTEATVTAMAEHWEVRPGGVVTLAGYGPASLGPGDAPPEEGATIGLSSGVKASTHEGKGRYLVSRIETDLTGDVKARVVTVTLVKPTQPLPEKRATKRTINSGGSTTPAVEGAPGEYVNPFPHGEWERSRIDQGVDFVNNSASSKVLAIGKGEVVAIGAPGWPAGGGVLYKLLDGPHQGDYVYAYENVRPHVSVGDQISAGQTIATMLGTGYPWIELGFADSSGVPISHAEYTEGLETVSGKEMSKLLDSLGAP
jgi:murein DD-endopeptidase MepM/ murein hydrolase activator NlpD